MRGGKSGSEEKDVGKGKGEKIKGRRQWGEKKREKERIDGRREWRQDKSKGCGTRRRL